ncbi:MAG: L,D-transpeptidase family protein [Bacteroidetes bacterium]|nr:L,D-transpeptidase family protein [Bacteroidota bacterium]
MKKTSFYVLLFFILTTKNIFSQIENSSQLIVVITENWEDEEGKLFLFEKESQNWKKINNPFYIKIGLNGLAWGSGINNFEKGNPKKEGDKKSPAGIFNIGNAFGYDSLPPKETKLNYTHSTKNIKCVDDVNSKFYNQIVDQEKISKDWNSAENMKFDDSDYKYGIVILNNHKNISGNGSCIFLHCFGKNKNATVGCTAMSEENILTLFKWIDPKLFPKIVQLPKKEYLHLQKKWNLPLLTLFEEK